MPDSLSRREFLEHASLGAAVALTPLSRQAATQPPARWKIIAFSKPFINLNVEDTADLVADVGWDGIECPVRRSSTHVVPERVEEDLPKMAGALKRRGREVSMITTDITGVDASAERILRTAAKLGIKTYRLGPIRYVADRSIPDQLSEITRVFAISRNSTRRSASRAASRIIRARTTLRRRSGTRCRRSRDWAGTWASRSTSGTPHSKADCRGRFRRAWPNHTTPSFMSKTSAGKSGRRAGRRSGVRSVKGW